MRQVFATAGLVDTGSNIDRVAGDCATAGAGGNGGPALEALFDNVVALAVDGAGRVFVSDAGNSELRFFEPGVNILLLANNAGSIDDGTSASGARRRGPRYGPTARTRRG